MTVGVLTMKIYKAKFHLVYNFFTVKGSVITGPEIIKILIIGLCRLVRFCLGRNGKKETKEGQLQLGERMLVKGERAPAAN